MEIQDYLGKGEEKEKTGDIAFTPSSVMRKGCMPERHVRGVA